MSKKYGANIGHPYVIKKTPEATVEVASVVVEEPQTQFDIDDVVVNVESWKTKREKKKSLPYGIKETPDEQEVKE